MEMLAQFLRIAKTVLLSDTFWTAVVAVGGVITLYLLYIQISRMTTVAAYDFLRKEDDRFVSERMARLRSMLARVLLGTPEDFQNIDEHADDVLGYFEDLGLMLRGKIAPVYLVWTVNAYYVLRYWETTRKYIDWVRREKNDPTYYTEFEFLHKAVAGQERKMMKQPRVEIGPEELRRFLEEELYVELRPFAQSDLDHVMGIERASFDPVDAYERGAFEELLVAHPRGAYVAENFNQVVGYVIFYSAEEVGEIDSIAVDPAFRRLGVARRLMQLALGELRRQQIRTCSLETRTTNQAAVRFFEDLGFQITDTRRGYYRDGGDAHIMTRKIAQ